MNIDRQEFLSWMHRIAERFTYIEDLLKPKVLSPTIIDGDELLDNQDVLLMLKISYRALQRYRTEKKLPYYRISGKIYYKRSDVYQFLRDSFKTPKRRNGTPS